MENYRNAYGFPIKPLVDNWPISNKNIHLISGLFLDILSSTKETTVVFGVSKNYVVLEAHPFIAAINLELLTIVSEGDITYGRIVSDCSDLTLDSLWKIRGNTCNKASGWWAKQMCTIFLWMCKILCSTWRKKSTWHHIAMYHLNTWERVKLTKIIINWDWATLWEVHIAEEILFWLVDSKPVNEKREEKCTIYEKVCGETFIVFCSKAEKTLWWIFSLFSCLHSMNTLWWHQSA